MFVQGKLVPRLKREAAIAREERRRGRPYKRIAAALGVSPSSVYAWTSDIELTPEQIERNRTGPGAPWNERDVARRAYSWSRKCRNKRLAYQRAGRHATLDGDPLHLAGCMLYWAEGSKGKNRIEFSNSELPMVQLFRRFVSECLGVSDDRFRLMLNVYLNNGLTLSEVESFWLQGLALPPECARKHMVNHTPTSSSGRRKGKLIHGVCSLSVAESTDLVQHIFGAIQEYVGFEESSWLG